MATIFLRAFTLYLIMLITLRGMGKHQLGQYQPYEFAMALLIADLASSPMSDVSTPLLHGVLPIGALFIVHGAITLLCMRSDKFREIVSGKPRVIAQDGVIDRAALDKLCLTLADVLEGLRSSGIMDPDDLGSAVIEANGAISAFPRALKRPPTTGELGISPPEERVPLMLIMDGRLQKKSLSAAGQSEASLRALLSRYALSERDILLASLNAQGELRVQTKDGAILYLKDAPPAGREEGAST